MIVLGIHGGVTLGQHEPCAAIAINGRIIASCEEERFLRIKSAYGQMPVFAVKECLKIAGVKWEDIDLIVSPGATYIDHHERLSSFFTHHYGSCPKIELIHHQFAHLASTFYGSGYDSSLVMSVDATGDGSAGMLGYASKADGIKILKEIPTTNSIGFFYTLMTYFLGFADGDEYKVMGLAPYGSANIDLSSIIKTSDDGWEFDWSKVRSDPPPRSPFEPLYAPEVSALLKMPHRKPADPVEQVHRDLAASIQKTFESCIASQLKWLRSNNSEERNLCMAGGTALNCSANKSIWYSGEFDNIFVPPVASDRGLAIGCAYTGAVHSGDTPWPLTSAYLGSAYSEDDIRNELTSNGVNFTEVDAPWVAASEAIGAKQIVGWHQGRSEIGARALGSRSILADPSTIDMRDKVNARIKYREEFRPFAPAVLSHRANNYFDMRNLESPFMCFTIDAHDKAATELGAVVHVDQTARVQTVRSTDNEPFYALLTELEKDTSCPVVLNTSFNLKGQPIVESPRDALMTFFGCGLDVLILGNFVVRK